MLRSDETVEQRMHKLCNRLRRQHARNPALLPSSAIAAFLLISLLLYLLSSSSSTTPPRHHPATTTFLRASISPRQSDDGSPIEPFKAGITPPPLAQPLSVRALSALRGQLDGRIVVHDFEACITIRRMMALVGEDREAGRRDGTGETDVDLDTYLAQLRRRVEEEDTQKREQMAAQQTVDSPAAESPSSEAIEQQMATMEEEWRGKVVALQEQVRELQAAVLQAKAAAAEADAASNLDDSNRVDGTDGRRRADRRRITFSKIQPAQPQSDAAVLSQPQSQSQPAAAAAGEPLPDVVKSPEEATLDKQTAQQQAGQSVIDTDEQQQHPMAGIRAAAASDRDEQQQVWVAGIQGGARTSEKDAKVEKEEEEWGKHKWKKRWRTTEHGKGIKKHDDDD